MSIKKSIVPYHSISKRLSFFMLGISTFLLSLLIVLSFLYYSHIIYNLEHESIKHYEESVHIHIHNQRSKLKTLASDWATREEITSFMSSNNAIDVSQDSIYRLSNIYEIDYMTIFDDQFQILFHQQITLNDSLTIPLHFHWNVDQSSITALNELCKNPEDSHTALIQDIPLLTGCSPIKSATDESIHLGYVIFGQLIDDSLIEEFSFVIGRQIQFVKQSSSVPTTTSSILSKNRDSMEVFYQGGFFHLSDEVGFIVSIPRVSFAIYEQSALPMYIIIVLFVLMGLVYEHYLIKKHFSSRLAILAKTVNTIRSNQSQRSVFAIDDVGDEITYLSHQFQHTLTEIEQQKKDEIHHAAYFYPQSGLPNYHSITNQLKHWIDDQTTSNIWVILMDVQDMTSIVSLYGQDYTNALLIRITSIFHQLIPTHWYLSQIGHNQFMFAIHNTFKDEVIKVIEKMELRFRIPIKVLQDEILVQWHIGISSYPDIANSLEALLHSTSVALRTAKQKESLPYVVFEKSIKEAQLRLAMLYNKLKMAMVNGEFVMNYQPKVDMTSKIIVGYEALLRWKNPELGNISPGEFIPIAEDYGLMPSIGEWVLHTVFEDMEKIKMMTGKVLPFSFNVSGKQLQSGFFADMVEAEIQRRQMEPHLIEIEITESVYMQSSNEIQIMIDRLRRIGVKLSIDDFGKGFSSLSILSKKRFDVIKIDSGFVWGIGNEEDEQVVKHIISISKTLGYDIIAEGVESIDQARFLTNLGCVRAQGFLYHRPLGIKQLIEVIVSDPK
jgi:EAL domain-containing protein (putative c-di-GMP-specific phosphodiesterase class I)/GGDEF domain-containing protein/sensor domain CHASE-containing protein